VKRLPRPRAIHLFVLGHFLVLGLSALMRYRSGHGAYFDIGVMDNLFWQTLHGRIFFYPQYEMSYLGDHFSPILFLFVPLYALGSHAATLILAQALALALGGLFVFRIARWHFEGPIESGTLSPETARRAAWVFVLLYAAHPALLYTGLFDFHPIAMMIPLSLAAYDSYLRRNWTGLACWLVLLAACKEEAAITVGAFGLYMLLFSRSTAGRRAGAVTLAAAAVYFVLVMKALLPAFQGPGDAGWAYGARYAHLGESPIEVLRTLLLHPIDALTSSWRPYKLETLAYLFLPLGLLPLLGWRGLIVALPCLAYNFLSNRWHQFDIHHHYFAPALGFLVIGAIQGLCVWLGLWRRVASSASRRKWIVVIPLGLALLATYRYLDELEPIRSRYFEPHPHAEQLKEIQRIVGPDASVSVTNRLAPSFAHRREYHLALDFTLNRRLNAALGLPDYRDTVFHVFDLSMLDGSQDRERRVATLLTDERYGVRHYRFPLVVFERGFARRPHPELEALLADDDDPDLWRVFPAIFLFRSDPREVEHDLGDTGRGAAMRFVAGRRGSVYGPYVVMPAGSYSVDFHLSLETPGTGEIAVIAVASEIGRRRHVERRLRRADFAGIGENRVFTLELDLDRETDDAELQTRSAGGPAFSLRKVVVRERRPVVR